MKKIILLLLLITVSCKSQSNSEKSVNSMINLLDNKSVLININYTTNYVLDKDAQRVIELNSDDKLKLLVQNLLIEDKALVSHIILTKLLEPTKDNFSYKYNYDAKGDVVSTTYSLNNLSWQYDDEHQRNKIVIYNKQTLYDYWSEKIKNWKK